MTRRVMVPSTERGFLGGKREFSRYSDEFRRFLESENCGLWMLVVDLSCGAFVVLRYVHSMPFVEHFCREWMLNFAKCFLGIYLDDHISIFHFVHVACCIDWFVDVDPFLSLWNKSYSLIPKNKMKNVSRSWKWQKDGIISDC